MDRDYFRYEDAYGRPRRKSNLFGWSVAILLLTGLAFAAWLGSFYIFGQPERPDSYRILKKLHKIDPTKRFELTAAPAGEFLSAKQLYDRYIAMSPGELTKTNAELARNFIRNYQQVRGLVPYVVGRYTIMEARGLTQNDLFTSGMIALTSAVDYGQLLMEHVYPSDPQSLPLMKQTLITGLEIKLERMHDLAAVVHAERLPDGRMLITVMPLLYGSYTVTRGPGTFSLEPPLDLNLGAGWPLFKESTRRTAESQFASYLERVSPAKQSVAAAGLAATPAPPAQNELIRVQPAMAVEPPKVAVATPPPPPSGKPIPTAKGGKFTKNQKPSPSPTASRGPPVVAQKNATATPPAVFTPMPTISATPVVAAAPPVSSAAPTPIPDNALASTAGGGTWKTFPSGKMPIGRLIATSDLSDLADRGIVGERVYLKGQFVVNFTEPTRAVLRPKTGLADTVLHFGRGGQAVRVIVEFPAGYQPPKQGSVVNRDEARPYEITEVRKQSDGQLNVFAREIMQ